MRSWSTKVRSFTLLPSMYHQWINLFAELRLIFIHQSLHQGLSQTIIHLLANKWGHGHDIEPAKNMLGCSKNGCNSCVNWLLPTPQRMKQQKGKQSQWDTANSRKHGKFSETWLEPLSQAFHQCTSGWYSLVVVKKKSLSTTHHSIAWVLIGSYQKNESVSK